MGTPASAGVSQPEVRRLLRVLSAGRICAEIGTGRGDGALAMASTAEAVVTVEVDRAQAREAAARLRTQENVRVLAGDWRGRLAALGPFGFVFLDGPAWPDDPAQLDEVVELLEVGGLLLVDDIEAEMRETDAARDLLLSHPQLRGDARPPLAHERRHRLHARPGRLRSAFARSRTVSGRSRSVPGQPVPGDQGNDGDRGEVAPRPDRLWSQVDDYLCRVLIGDDPLLVDVVARSSAAGLPPREVAPNQGKLLYLLALIQRARAILEIGTLGAYSTIWLARALPADGRLVTLEADHHCASVARENLEVAGMPERVQVWEGDALDTLPELERAALHPFDFVFIDADKANNPAYFAWALRLSRRGSVIVADNVVRAGAIVRDAAGDATTAGVRDFLELVAAEPRVEATALQTVGGKGHDGFALVVVTN